MQKSTIVVLYLTGNLQPESWKGKPVPVDFYYLKGICSAICSLAGVEGESFAG